MRFFTLLIVFSFVIYLRCPAQTTGFGCLVNNQVYTVSLGTGYPYGVPAGSRKIYKNPGSSYSINYNGYSATKPNNENYICGVVNYYTSPVSRQEMTILSYDCVTEATLGGAVTGDGAYVRYSINNPSFCASTPVPIENQTWLFLFMIIVGTVSLTFFRKRIIFKNV
ncbi:MAG: hypothetical protein JKY70_01215 [Mucilaginibacter sp.]|nr:hypothetical protein [Mucilaginibacter sp.]